MIFLTNTYFLEDKLIEETHSYFIQISMSGSVILVWRPEVQVHQARIYGASDFHRQADGPRKDGQVDLQRQSESSGVSSNL